MDVLKVRIKEQLEHIDHAQTGYKKHVAGYLNEVAEFYEKNTSLKLTDVTAKLSVFDELVAHKPVFKDFGGMLEYGDTLTVIYDKAREVINGVSHIVDNNMYIKYMVEKISSSSTAPSDDLNRMIAHIHQHADEIAAAEHKIFEIMAAQLPWMVRDTDHQQLADLVIKRYADARLSQVTLIIIRYIIGKVDEKSYKMLNAMLEKEKDRVLGAKRYHIPDTYSSLQQVLTRAKLIPVSDFMEFRDLVHRLGVSAQSLDELKNAGNVCVVVWYKCDCTAIEYNMRGLIDREYIIEHDLLLDQSIGINSRVIKKYATMKSVAEPTFDRGIEILGNKDLDTAYVLETYDGTRFRIIAQSALKLEVPLKTLTSTNERVMLYNEELERVILSKCFTGGVAKMMKDFKDEKQKLPQTSVLFGQVREQYMDAMRGVFTKFKPKNHKAVREIIFDAPHLDIIIDLLFSALFGRFEFDAVNTYNYENFISNTHKFHDLSVMYVKKFRAMWSGVKLPSEMFKNHSGAGLADKIVDYLGDVINRLHKELERQRAFAEFDVNLKQYYLTKGGRV